MTDSTVLSIRVSKETKERLARIAKSTRRTQSFLAAEAIEEFVAVQEWQITGVQKAAAALDRGEDVLHEEVKKWAASLAADGEPPESKTE